MSATKRGIYHNLRKSNYTISNAEVVFFFSSVFYMNKFMAEYKEHRNQFSKHIDKVTDTPLNMDTLADITLYQTIEKRGFHAWLKGVSITWEELHRYALRTMIEPNTKDWLITPSRRSVERIKSMV